VNETRTRTKVSWRRRKHAAAAIALGLALSGVAAVDGVLFRSVGQFMEVERAPHQLRWVRESWGVRRDGLRHEEREQRHILGY
jgi:hypothetical protein